MRSARQLKALMSFRIKTRTAYYGGSFDPVHNGHIEIAQILVREFNLDRFVFIPAFHAPHKKENTPASPFHRFAMLTMATLADEALSVSSMELEDPEHPYSIETLTKLRSSMPDDDIFFVIGADSWEEITTWRRWEEVLSIVNIIVVTRPGFDIGFRHVTDEVISRVIDLRVMGSAERDGMARGGKETPVPGIFVTDSVNIDVSATKIRRMVREGAEGWRKQVPESAAKHIDKYGLYS